MGLALGTNLKFHTSVTKRLKQKVRKFWGLTPTFAEVTEEILVGRGLVAHPPSPSILNRVKKIPTEDPVKMAEFVLNNNIFEFNSKAYQQKSGTAIGV